MNYSSSSSSFGKSVLPLSKSRFHFLYFSLQNSSFSFVSNPNQFINLISHLLLSQKSSSKIIFTIKLIRSKSHLGFQTKLSLSKFFPLKLVLIRIEPQYSFQSSPFSFSLPYFTSNQTNSPCQAHGRFVEKAKNRFNPPNAHDKQGAPPISLPLSPRISQPSI